MKRLLSSATSSLRLMPNAAAANVGVMRGTQCQFSTNNRQRQKNIDQVAPSNVLIFSKKDTMDFMTVFPDLVRELTYEGRHKDSLPMLNKHLARVLQYNVPHGKKNRGLTVPATFRLLTPEDQHTKENMHLAIILGWCVELLQAFFLVSDDIMDQSESRRGQPCWYKKEDIGLDAFNDSLFLESCIYTTLAKHFKDKPYYTDCLHAFIATTRHTILGQSLDLLSSSKKGGVDVDIFEMKRYSAIVKHKTSYYSFFLPVALGMSMAGFKEPESFRQARTVLLEMGHFFQVQDDYLDCFGDPAVTGKKGTDIEEGKCTWLACVAMQRANTQQKQILRDNYGIDNEANVAVVKQLYNDLQIPKVFDRYEEDSYQDIVNHIEQMSPSRDGKKIPPLIFHMFLHRIYKRES